MFQQSCRERRRVQNRRGNLRSLNPEWDGSWSTSRRTRQGVVPTRSSSCQVPVGGAFLDVCRCALICVLFGGCRLRDEHKTQQTQRPSARSYRSRRTTTFSRALHLLPQFDLHPYNQIGILTPLTLVLLRSPATAVTGTMALQTCAKVHKGANGLAFGTTGYLVCRLGRNNLRRCS